MTFYWWMHWFWITFTLKTYSLPTHSMSLTSPSSVSSNLDVHQNRSSIRPINLIEETTIPKPQTAVQSYLNGTLKVPHDYLMQTKMTVNSDPTLRISMKNNTLLMNLTSDIKHKTYSLNSKNQTNVSQEVYSDHLQTTTDVYSNEFTDKTETTPNNFTDFVNVTNTSTVIVTKELISAKIDADEDISVSQWTALSIFGVCFGILLCISFIIISTIILYRRRYLNKPQTLNDKCSNPDSSGYIDDSTIRENSEEMYSLDNDSFLNSLEAMTIQNYWTDSVKHTKL